MTPRGKVKELIDAMQAQPEKVQWLVPECAEIVGPSVSSTLAPAVRHEWLFKHKVGGVRVAYSLQPQDGPQEEAEEPEELPPFNAALWADGDLVLVGLQINQDGHSATLGPEQVRQLCRLLHGQGPEE